ncbi:macrophage mannose receptor 1-like [Trachinotus anak]|uniref:macrophage mannose receptor 1-like n=1 Tax=Trachinotus anak TaxID=443729 RepID=UPI0039F1AC0A
MTWTHAQHYCREKHTDLATIESADDLSSLIRPKTDTSWIWIGLTDDPKSWKGVMGKDANSWRWSATGETSETDYHNWYSNEPNNEDAHQKCVLMYMDGRWIDATCQQSLSYVCFDDTNPPGQRTYTVKNDPQTWNDAQTYCRTYHTDLAVIGNAQENAEVMSMMSTQFVWIGLYRVPWRWSDKSSSSFRNWLRGEPNQPGREYCAVENPGHFFGNLNCDAKVFSWCYKDLRVKLKLVRVKIQADADLSDPATNTQIVQQLGERFKALRSDVTLRWATQPRKQGRV